MKLLKNIIRFPFYLIATIGLFMTAMFLAFWDWIWEENDR